MSNQGHDWMKQGATIVDSLDTLWLMGLNDEWQQARDWVASQLNFDADIAVQRPMVGGAEGCEQVSFFETTIRCLGGLIAAYELSGECCCMRAHSLYACVGEVTRCFWRRRDCLAVSCCTPSPLRPDSPWHRST